MGMDKIKKLEKKLEAFRNKSDKGASGRKKVDTLIKLAHVLYISDPEKSENYAKQAFAITKKLGYRKGIANSCLMMGHCYHVRDEYDKTIEYYHKALKINEEIGNKHGVANSCISIGAVYDKQSDFDKSLRYQFKALKIFEEIGDKRGIAKSCNNIGVIYSKLSEFEQGLKYFLKALKTLEEIGEREGIAASLSNISMIYTERSDYNEALEYLAKALKIYEEIGHKIGIGNCCIDIGNNYEKQGAYEQALEYHLKALKVYQEIGNRGGIATSYGSIGRVQTKLKHYDAALSYLQKCLQLAKEVGTRQDEVETYRNLSELYEAQQNYEQALSYYKKYTEVEKETFNAEKSKQIAEMSTKYETEKKEKEAEIYHLKNVKLRKEIRERKKVEEELKKHHDQLEELVKNRTVELKKELTKRQVAEKELLKHQNQLIALNHALSLVEEKQRRKTATYLHDNIGQALSLAIFKIRSLQESNPAKNVRRELAEIKDIVAQTNQRTRSLTFEISPPVLYELGLEPAIEWLAGQFQKQHGITCSFKDDGVSKRLTDEARILLFQAVRELLTNISKHARAQKAQVSTARVGNAIRISVDDDGIGFNPDSLDLKITHNEGFGLFNIKERLRRLGGKLEVSSNKGHGTSIVLIAPLKRKPGKKNRKRR